MIALQITPDIVALLARDLATDIGTGDRSTAAFPEWRDITATAELVAREAGIVAGIELGAVMWQQMGGSIVSEQLIESGATVAIGDVIARYRGPATILLAGERTLLNLITHLSGIATLTARYVMVCEGTGSRIYDTRKTLPGLRQLQKYAVRCGGGQNHRMGLFDAVMLKDNHLALLQIALTEAVQRVRAQQGSAIPIEIEVETLEQFRAAAAAGVDIIMLDNMTLEEVAACVAERPAGILLEVSGGLTLDRIAELAALGIDRLSIGRLTHSAPSLDLALDFQPVTAATGTE